MAASLTTNGVLSAEQPSFMCKPSGAQSSPATGATVVFNTEIYDQGSDFASNTFTAPVTGRYQFNCVLRIDASDLDNNYTYFHQVTSNRNYEFGLTGVSAWDANADYRQITWGGLCDLDASDTAYIRYNFSGGDTIGSLSVNCFYSGFLVC